MPPEAPLPKVSNALPASPTMAPWSNTKKAFQAWSRTCDVYSRYFTSLSHSQNPQAVIAANMEFMTGGLQIFSLNVLGLDKTEALPV